MNISKKIKRLVKKVIIPIIVCLSSLVIYCSPAMDTFAASMSASITINDRGTAFVANRSHIQDLFANLLTINNENPIQYNRKISIVNDEVEVSLSFKDGIDEINLQLSGRLYLSYRSNDQYPVYVASLASNNPKYKCVYFEISNGESPYNLNYELRTTSSITMYLLDTSDNLLSFGNKFKIKDFELAVYEIAPSDIDYNWYFGIINGKCEEEIPIVPMSIHTTTWAGNFHSLYYTVANYEHRFFATPYIDIQVIDVPKAGNSNWFASLKISESSAYRQVGSSTWISKTGSYTRAFIIDNAKLVWTAGGNTKITNVTPYLNCSAGSGIFSFLPIIATITSIIPQTATLSTILSAADSILNSGSSSSATNQTAIGGTNCGVFKMKFPSEYYIEESGYGINNLYAERFELDVSVATNNSSLTKNINTYAVVDFSFDISWDDIYGDQPGSQSYSGYKYIAYVGNVG